MCQFAPWRIVPHIIAVEEEEEEEEEIEEGLLIATPDNLSDWGDDLDDLPSLDDFLT